MKQLTNFFSVQNMYFWFCVCDFLIRVFVMKKGSTDIKANFIFLISASICFLTPTPSHPPVTCCVVSSPTFAVQTTAGLLVAQHVLRTRHDAVKRTRKEHRPWSTVLKSAVREEDIVLLTHAEAWSPMTFTILILVKECKRFSNVNDDIICTPPHHPSSPSKSNQTDTIIPPDLTPCCSLRPKFTVLGKKIRWCCWAWMNGCLGGWCRGGRR